ncbi:MAG: hypothetical protein LBR15_02935 [Methanobrevibacter sp.]|nr:hypothetical protein [Candidatus Methanovirga australis]
MEIIIFDRLKKEHYDLNNPMDLIFMHLFDLLSPKELKKAIRKREMMEKNEKFMRIFCFEYINRCSIV